MYFEFRNKNLKKLCENFNHAKKILGKQDSNKLFLRMTQIQAVDSIFDLIQMPAVGCHLLKGNRKNQFAVKLAGGKRLIIKPLSDIEKYMKKDQLVFKKIDEIIIWAVVDYHG